MNEEINKFVGSCPHCGTRIWSKDKIAKTTEFRDGEWIYLPLYQCLGCKMILQHDEMVPF